jgi:N-hydroxyarylamine O-acetyltransferase
MSSSRRAGLSSASAEGMLERIGFKAAPPMSSWGLAEIYRAWCRSVPFDNVLRRIQICEGAEHDGARLPGWTPEEFARDYLTHGVGGPCAPAGITFESLLQTLGFATRIVLATMEDPDGESLGHVTTVVTVGDEVFLVDTVILCEAPIPMPREGSAVLPDPIHPVEVRRRCGAWRIAYASAMTRAPAVCTVTDRVVDEQAWRALYRETQASRTFRRFNGGLYIRRNVQGGVSVIYRDCHVIVDGSGRRERWVGQDERDDLLLGDFGLSQEIVSRLPPETTWWS